MSEITSWGYSIDELKPLVTTTEFDSMTFGRFSGDVRVQSALDAATAAVRNYCGWHVGPSAKCSLSARAHELRMIYSGPDTIIQLPAMFVSAVTKVKVGDYEITDYSFEPNGLLRIYDTMIGPRKTVITVEYTAGLDADDVKSLIANRAVHGLAQSYGVQSEAAGGVSVSYAASWLNSAGASALPDDNRSVLEPYRLQGVF